MPGLEPYSSLPLLELRLLQQQSPYVYGNTRYLALGTGDLEIPYLTVSYAVTLHQAVSTPMQKMPKMPTFPTRMTDITHSSPDVKSPASFPYKRL